MAKKITIFLVAALIAGLGAFRLASGFKAAVTIVCTSTGKRRPRSRAWLRRVTTSIAARLQAASTLKIASGVPEPHYSDATVSSGKTYYYVVTSVDAAGHESGFSRKSKPQCLERARPELAALVGPPGSRLGRLLVADEKHQEPPCGEGRIRRARLQINYEDHGQEAGTDDRRQRAVAHHAVPALANNIRRDKPLTPA